MSEIPNPFMHIGSGGKTSAPMLFAPVKGRGLLTTPLERPMASLVLRLIVQSRIRSGSGIEVSEADRVVLRRIGAFIAKDAAPREVHFAAPPGLAEIRNTMEQRPVSQAADALQQQGHVKLDNVLPAAHVASFNEYTSRAVREGWVKREEGFSDRFATHNSIAGKAYHATLATLISRIARRPLMPSYSYLTSYLPGADLPLHTDRPQCDYTLALHLGLEDEAPGSWPLRMQKTFDDEACCAYDCRPGEAVLFRGRRLRHGRPPREGQGLYNQILWHFVEEGFEGSLD